MSLSSSTRDTVVSDAIVFDLDDTLYLERDYLRSGFSAVARHCAYLTGESEGEIGADFERLFAEAPQLPVFDRWLRSRSLPTQTHLDAMVSVYREHTPSIRLVPGAREALDELVTRHRLGLLTDGSSTRQHAKLTAVGLSGFFAAVVVSDEIGPDVRKPDPRPFVRMAGKLGVAPGDSVYIADNPEKDFIGARSAGFRSIRLRLSEGLHAQVEPATVAHAPDAEIRALSAAAVERAIGGFRPSSRSAAGEKSNT
jgi:putative hydrolase of the HAD superfamily